MSKVSLTVTIVSSILSALIGAYSTWWLNDVYSQPRIDYYSRPYFKIHDIAIGNVYLFNSGKKTDKNIAITLGTNISKNDIKIVDYTSKFEITNNDNKTIINLDELKPGEGADITFQADPTQDDTSLDIVSYSNNIRDGYSKEWSLPLPIYIAIVAISMVIGGIFGIFVTNFLLKRK